jgi:hypothetical protein
VGIGTPDPKSILNLYTANPELIIQDTMTSSTQADASLYLAESGANGAVGHSHRMRYYQRDLIFSLGDYPQSTNVEVMRFHETSIGSNVYNVGIGTSSPALPLDVHGNYIGRWLGSNHTNADNTYYKHSSSVRDSYYMGRWDGPDAMGPNKCFLGMELKVDTASNMGISSGDNQSAIMFHTWGSGIFNSREVMRIDAHGKVGIGTSSPDKKLHIKGAGGGSAGIQIESTTSPGAGFMYIQRNTDGKAYVLNASNHALILGANNMHGNTEANTQLYLDKNGRVGIGTSSPSALLDVNGGMRAAYNTATISYFGYAAVGYVGHSDYAGFAHLGVNTATKYALIQNRTGTTLLNAASGKNLHFRIENVDKMILKSNGYFGIGTSSPGEKLEVVGNIKITGYLTRSTTNSGFLCGLSGDANTKPIFCMASQWIPNANNLASMYGIGWANGGSVSFVAGTGNGYGMYVSSAGTVKWWLGAGNSYFTGGNFGIGTSSPRATLNVTNNIVNNAAGTTIPTAYGGNSTTTCVLGHGVTNSTQNYWGLNIGTLYSGKSYIQGCNTNGEFYNLLLNPKGGNVGIGISSADFPLIIGAAPSTVKDYRGTVFKIAPPGAGYSGGVGITINGSGGGSHNNSTWLEFVPTNTNSGHGKTCFIGAEGDSSTTYSSDIVFKFRTASSSYRFNNTTERMRISHGGNVGIGTTAPERPLHIKRIVSGDATNNIYDMIKIEGEYSSDFGGSAREGGTSILWWAENATNQGLPGEAARIVAGCYESSSSTEYHSYLAFHTSNNSSSSGTNERMCIDDNGFVGIGTKTPVCPLDINIYTSVYTGQKDYWYGTYYDSSAWLYSVRILNSTYFSMCIDAREGYTFTRVVHPSDQRIKKNIVEIDDGASLKKVRDISCVWYNYIDEKNSHDRVSGFIAQQVKEHVPEAVSTVAGFIPNKMEVLNVNWSETIMKTNDLPDVSGVKYRFYVSDLSGNEEKKIDLVGSPDNSFTFKKKWDTVFCYGKEVEDFHILDKSKLFAINFSATQEIDRMQQAEKIKVEELQKENSELKTEIETLKTQMSAILERLNAAGI